MVRKNMRNATKGGVLKQIIKKPLISLATRHNVASIGTFNKQVRHLVFTYFDGTESMCFCLISGLTIYEVFLFCPT